MKSESFNGRLRNELLNRELFFTRLAETKLLVSEYCEHYNRYRPRSALGFKTPAQLVAVHLVPVSATIRLRQDAQQPQPNTLIFTGILLGAGHSGLL
jgi:hypothetical protein